MARWWDLCTSPEELNLELIPLHVRFVVHGSDKGHGVRLWGSVFWTKHFSLTWPYQVWLEDLEMSRVGIVPPFTPLWSEVVFLKRDCLATESISKKLAVSNNQPRVLMRTLHGWSNTLPMSQTHGSHRVAKRCISTTCSIHGKTCCHWWAQVLFWRHCQKNMCGCTFHTDYTDLAHGIPCGAGWHTWYELGCCRNILPGLQSLWSQTRVLWPQGFWYSGPGFLQSDICSQESSYIKIFFSFQHGFWQPTLRTCTQSHHCGLICQTLECLLYRSRSATEDIHNFAFLVKS